MLAVFSEPLFVKSKFGGEYQLTVHGSQDELFQDWVRQSSDAVLWTFFSSLCEGITERQLTHYHLKIYNGRYDTRARSQHPEWKIVLLYGKGTEEGPLQVSRCMSCDLDCPLILGVLGQEAAAATAVPPASATEPEPAAAVDPPQQPTAACAASVASASLPAPVADDKAQNTNKSEPAAGSAEAQVSQQSQQRSQQQHKQSPVSRDSLLQETEHHRVWLDAKARPMFIITPKRHVEQLVDLTEAELVDLFRTAAALPEAMGCHSVQTMVLNQGDNRNHAHLHLKVRIHERDFERAAAGWSAQHKASLQLMRDFTDTLPPEHRGTMAAFLLRQRGEKKKKKLQQPPGQRQGQHQQRRVPWKQQRPQ